MKFLLTEKQAAYGLIIIFSTVVLFHLLVLSGLLPHTIVWGGRLSNRAELIQFELISIGLNLGMLFLILIRAGLVPIRINSTMLKALLWAMAGLFMLNTVGNLLSVNDFERITFTPITALLSVFCTKLALTTKPARAV